MLVTKCSHGCRSCRYRHGVKALNLALTGGVLTLDITGLMGLMGFALAMTAATAKSSSPYLKWDIDCRGRSRTADPFNVRGCTIVHV